MVGNTDRPILDIKNDTFGVLNYVNGISKFILNCDTPMTISIQGDWGSGKTSMMNMIDESIAANAYTIWFNTWQFSQFNMQNQLAISMLYSLLAELDYDQDSIRKVFGIIGGAMKIATGFITEKIAGGYLAGEITEAMDGGSYDLAIQIKDLKEKFQKAINEKIKKSNKERAVIFIDDLDRLQPSKAVELLEVLKIFLDCENCVFVLAVDYDVVTQGIKQKFGNSVDETKGKSFFDKIIQLPFKMPVSSYNISKYVNDILNDMNINVSPGIISEYVTLITYSVGCNPRSMKRLFNTYLLLDIIIKGTGQISYDEIKHKILFGLICIQTEFEELYKYIISNSDILDADFFLELEDDLHSNNDILETLQITEDSKLNKMAFFMKKFNGITNITDNKNIQKLKELISISTITSVNVSESVDEKNDMDWKYRYINKEISAKINSIIANKTSYEFKIWQPRKNTNERKISYVWDYCNFKSKSGLDVQLAYDISTDYVVGINSVSLYFSKGELTNSNDFFDTFSNSPLLLSSEKTKTGYVYNNIYKFSETDKESAINEIASLIINNINTL